MKLYQLIWLLVKHWRYYKQEVNFVGLYKFLIRKGLGPLTPDEWDDVRSYAFEQSVVEPTPEQVERNKLLVTRSIRSGSVEIVPKANHAAPIPLESKEEADRQFWKMMETANPVILQTNKAFDKRKFEEMKMNIDKRNIFQRLLGKTDPSDFILDPYPVHGEKIEEVLVEPLLFPTPDVIYEAPILKPKKPRSQRKKKK